MGSNGMQQKNFTLVGDFCFYTGVQLHMKLVGASERADMKLAEQRTTTFINIRYHAMQLQHSVHFSLVTSWLGLWWDKLS